MVFSSALWAAKHWNAFNCPKSQLHAYPSQPSRSVLLLINILIDLANKWNTGTTHLQFQPLEIKIQLFLSRSTWTSCVGVAGEHQVPDLN